MSLGTITRAFKRAKDKGFLDTADYGAHVVIKRARNAFLDLRYGGKLSRDRADEWRQRDVQNDRGRYANMPTDIYALDAIWQRIAVKPTDKIVDIGCGDGRVVAYCLSRGHKGKIVGIELMRDAFEIAAARFAKYPNVEIIEGDATVIDPAGDVYFLCNPFQQAPTAKFEEMLRGRNVTIAYLNHPHLDCFSPDHWNIDRTNVIKPDYRQYRFAILTPKR